MLNVLALLERVVYQGAILQNSTLLVCRSCEDAARYSKSWGLHKFWGYRYIVDIVPVVDIAFTVNSASNPHGYEEAHERAGVVEQEICDQAASQRHPIGQNLRLCWRFSSEYSATFSGTGSR